MSMGSQPGVFSELSRCVSWGSQPPAIPGLPPEKYCFLSPTLQNLIRKMPCLHPANFSSAANLPAQIPGLENLWTWQGF